MITPGLSNLTAYIGSTWDAAVTFYPSSDAVFNWSGNWISSSFYSVGTAVVGSDNNAYAAKLASNGINPVGDMTGSWSTPLTPLDLDGYHAELTIMATATDEYTATPLLATPVPIQGQQGFIYMKLTSAQTSTFQPGSVHYYLTLTQPNGDPYYWMNGSFTWVSP